jgi:L-ascorbate metabolism protein UlaG (beta-lactamase superfamily)
MSTGEALLHDIESCEVPAGRCALWWMGQHGFILKLGRTVAYLDVFLSPREGRLVEPPLAPSQARLADLILGTHDHIDHIDRPSWPAMAAASPKARFLVPELLRAGLNRDLGIPEDRVIGLDSGRTVQIGEITVTAIPAAHEQLARDPATGLHPCLGYFLSGNGFRLYHAGDCCLYEGLHALLRSQPADLYLLPINGRNAPRYSAGRMGNMTYQEAADLAGELHPGCVIPTHYDMFARSAARVDEFTDYLRCKYPQQRFLVPAVGERAMLG